MLIIIFFQTLHLAEAFVEQQSDDWRKLWVEIGRILIDKISSIF